jgi:ubiquinone/menaquinone biosynthesis C-methylase UbiE
VPELKSNVEWKQWGKDDPLFGVASWAHKQKDGAAAWTEEEFYACGESDWNDFRAHWQQYGLNTRSCLEIGCGAGRITGQISRAFERVCAVDVSKDMMSRAQGVVGENVEFSLIDGLHLPQEDGSMSAVFSTHVLQHLDNVDIGLAYFHEIFRVLQVGGTAMVHMPLYRFPANRGPLGIFLKISYSGWRRFSNLSAGVKRRLGRKTMRGTQYPIEYLSTNLARIGFKKIEYRIFPTMSNGDFHPFVFVTK